MAQTGLEVVSRVRNLIQDADGNRWDDAEMLGWLNDGLLEIVTLKPSAKTGRRTLGLTSGTIQTLPSDAVQLLRVTHNSNGNSIRVVDIDRLDAADPTWRSMAKVDLVQHYMYDALYPTEFEVYPPNTGQGAVVAVLALKPTKMVSLPSNVPIDDIYLPPLVDYLLYRAYSKHSKFAGNEQRANNAYARFGQALGVRMSMESSMDPRVTNKDPNAGVE